ncbi:molybdenum cofactor guanylyltransferase MobA [Methylocapsa palsarum]|uniref:Molybdenum cofactor guanylyltransferase n=1 Tax=Methylocapsa palsarum TaxID=1612308 RepID=A0A1I3Y696_9HYPH|nr:molybdenum cofactor guanylyltransferase MobA [Methylocapsa palsarum]SFK26919.1 molybdopterin-guanine dinucleotide biosynthesis protein A [Methylocapsa palsarum]
MTDLPFGIVLAGGLASRMGGGDKGLRTIGGGTILGRVIECLRPQCAGLVLNANGDPARLAEFGLPVVADDLPGFKGPLAGLLAGLDWMAARRPDVAVVLSAPSDTPFLPGDLVGRLAAARREQGADIACASSCGGLHPVVALWPVNIRADLRHALVDEDERKIDRFTRRYKVAAVDWRCEPLDPFFNANEPADLQAAEAFLQRKKGDF